jgi:hypothetical protein
MPSAIPIEVNGTGTEAVQATGVDFYSMNGTGAVNGIEKRVNGVNGVRAETWPVNGHPRTLSQSSSAASTSAQSSGPMSNGAVNGQHTGSYATEVHDFHETEAGGPRSHAFAHIQSWADDPKSSSYPRISKPMELMRHAYDCVVIGSGYGGGVAASRMARAGKRVCLLERGQERWPGEFPTDTGDALDQLHFSGQFAPPWLPKKIVSGGDPTGMYHLIFGNGQNAVVGNGKFSYAPTSKVPVA